MLPTDQASENRRFTKYLSHWKKLRVEKPVYWDHHRGGWRLVVDLIREQLHIDDGILFISAVDEFIVSREVVREPWVGFIHGVPNSNYKFPDLERLLQMDTWKANIRHCLGIWVLSDYIKEFLDKKNLPCPINRIYYPVEIPEQLFSFQDFLHSEPRKILFVGEYLRNYESFYDLSTPGYEKILLRCFPKDKKQKGLISTDSVKVIDRISDEAYDSLMANSIIFLNLLDSPANTTISEAIVRTTPVLVNNVGSVKEYLGESYPYYYNDLDEATRKLQDIDLIAKTVIYLKKWRGVRNLSFDQFIFSLQNSQIYRTLPVPRSQKTMFTNYDITIVICSYNRVGSLEDLLNCFCQQDYDGEFEIILWNNNIEFTDEVNSIVRKFESRLNIKLIHSSENYYCIIRLAILNLMRSNLLMICDDDVKPEPTYISTFLTKYQEYGPNVVLCARGHVFLPHKINQENPEIPWKTGKNLIFYDECQNDRQVHFLHADNALIPKHILRKIVQFDIERYEFVLIDDYWISFIISHELDIPILKIKADKAFTFIESANDPSIAMFHDDKVAEQRVNFYIYHMQRNWPEF
jgi:hypothetical protein